MSLDTLDPDNPVFPEPTAPQGRLVKRIMYGDSARSVSSYFEWDSKGKLTGFNGYPFKYGLIADPMKMKIRRNGKGIITSFVITGSWVDLAKIDSIQCRVLWDTTAQRYAGVIKTNFKGGIGYYQDSLTWEYDPDNDDIREYRYSRLYNYPYELQFMRDYSIVFDDLFSIVNFAIEKRDGPVIQNYAMYLTHDAQRSAVFLYHEALLLDIPEFFSISALSEAVEVHYGSGSSSEISDRYQYEYGTDGWPVKGLITSQDSTRVPFRYFY